MAYNEECLPRFVRYARNVMGISIKGTDKEIAEAGIRAMENFYRRIGMPVNLDELGVRPTDEQIEEMADRCVAASGNRIGSAKKLSREDLVRIYTNACKAR